MKRAFFTVLMLGSLLPAAGCSTAPRLDTRTFTLAHLRPDQAQKLIDPYVFTDRAGAPGHLSVTSGALTVRETPDNLDKIERVLKQYDRAQPDVRLHFQLIEADDFKGSDPRIATIEGELKKIFQFRGYRLAGDTYVEATDRSMVSQRFQGADATYEVSTGVQWLGPSEIQLISVKLQARGYGTLLQTTVNVQPGQTLVLGSSPKLKGTGTLLLAVRADSVGS